MTSFPKKPRFLKYNREWVALETEMERSVIAMLREAGWDAGPKTRPTVREFCADLTYDQVLDVSTPWWAEKFTIKEQEKLWAEIDAKYPRRKRKT